MTHNPVPVSPAQAVTRRRLLGYAGLALVLLLILAWCLNWWYSGRFLVETDDAYLRADIVTIAPRVAGYLAAVEVQDNQPLKAGDLLARIDDSDYQARVEQAEAALREALAEQRAGQARLANLAARQQQQQSLIAEAQARVGAAEAEAQRAGQEGRRQQHLASQQVSSVQQLENAAALARQADAALGAARATLAARRQQVQVLDTEQQSARAQLDKLAAGVARVTAQRQLARIDLARTLIRSPVDGIAGQRRLRLGQYVEVGAPLLAVVPEDAYVVANYKETQVDGMRPGQPARVEVDALGGHVLLGRVESFAPASGAEFALLPADNATGNFTKIVQRMPVRIRLDPGQARQAELRPGMSVVVSVDTRHD
ncbi:HlyD family secretion protein [Pseudomonas protegens]|uniref:HlyD family secretion protein n=1 Tax=Pseudomonas protegens TaxID=380021 RepID=A0A9Q6IBG0_9PSED|nr:HlyD family secretion protein [Pseudomonas protegens]PYC30038.1 HlyD family secretion protein [Pseudomonas protegens]